MQRNNKPICRFVNACIAILLVTGQLHAQISDGFVPCQVMPQLMTDYKADLQAINNFYSPTIGNDFYKRYYESSDPGASPEKRARLQTLYKEYLDKVAAIDLKVSISPSKKPDFFVAIKPVFLLKPSVEELGYFTMAASVA